MDLRQLTTFVQVADLGSLSKAAERLRIAQPALSRQIRLLEEELKVTLFTRHGRGMVLTPAGELLRGRASGILRQVEEARADLMEEAGAVRGRVVFGMPPTVGDVLATRLIERFLALHPEVRLRVVTTAVTCWNGSATAASTSPSSIAPSGSPISASPPCWRRT